MKRGISIILFVMFFASLLPLISAEIIFNQQPQQVYNLGDQVPISMTLKTTSQTSGFFQMELICQGEESVFYKNPISMSVGEEKKIETTLILEKTFIQDLTGDCTIKASFGQEYKVSNSFKLSNLINVKIFLNKTAFDPTENILISGQAVKENGENSNGFVEISFLNGNESIANKSSTINNGILNTNLSVPNNTKAGSYVLNIYAYEKDSSDEITNTGVFLQNIQINQIPTNIEIVFQNESVLPGNSVMIKPILHDQTGDSISSDAILTIKDSNNKIIEQQNVQTDSFFEFPIKYNEKPSSWKVVVASNKLTTESQFTILEKESADFKFLNQTLTVTNTGNVPYNKTILIKLGNESLNLNVYLDVDESKKFVLSAPDGNYNVQILVGGLSPVEPQNIFLTGNAINIKEAPVKILDLVGNIWVWIFVVLICGFVIFILAKRNYKKSSVGYIPISSPPPKSSSKKISGAESTKISNVNEDMSIKNAAGKKENVKLITTPNTGGTEFKFSLPAKEPFIDSRNKAEVEVSIKGDKQELSVSTLYIKNFDEARRDQGVKETLKKITSYAEDKKAILYESGNSLIFIFSPVKTRTFKNEKAALDIAQSIKESLLYHNKVFKQKINFGISLAKGYVIAKVDSGTFKFADVSSLMLSSKKLASLAENDILLSEKISEGLKDFVKTSNYEKTSGFGIKSYQIRETKNPDQHSQFIKSFLQRLDKS